MKFYIDFPDNETWQHFALKIAGWKWLSNHCQLVGMEGYITGCPKDVIGIKTKFDNECNELTDLEIRIIEAKASRSDFFREFGSKNNRREYSLAGGYADYYYIITPYGMMDIDEIPKGYGWLEADLENGYLFPECSKRPQRQERNNYLSMEEEFKRRFTTLAWANSSRFSSMIRLRQDED